MSIWSCLSVSGQLHNYIFTCIAELVEWVAKQNYNATFLMYYLDDFHTLGPPGSSVCQHNLDRSIDCFSKLGISLHLDKLEGPSTCLTIPRIELDSLNLQERLPQNKVDRITFVEDWSQKRWCKRKELESLIGHLQHACKVVPQGRSFFRRMINLLCAFRRDDHPIRLNQEFFLDLAWWQEFFQSWNGCSFLQYPQWAPLPNFEVSSDALGLLVRRMAPHTGLSVYQVQRTFPYPHGSLPLGSPTGLQTGQLPIR